MFDHIHKRLLKLAGSVKAPVAAVAAVGLAIFYLNLTQAALVGAVIAKIFNGASLKEVQTLILTLIAVLVIRAIVVWSREAVSIWAGAVIRQRLRDRMYNHLIGLGPGYVSTVRSGAVQSTMVDGIEGLDAYYSKYLPQLIVVAIGPVSVLIWIATRSPLLAAIAFSAIIAIPIMPRIWDKLLVSRGRTHWNAYRELSADYLDAMQGISTLKAANATTHRREMLVKRGNHLFESTMAQMAISLIDTGVTEFAIQIGTAVTVAIGAVLVANGQLDVTTLVLLMVLIAVTFRPFRELTRFWHAGFLGVSASVGIEQMLNTKPYSPDQPGAKELPADIDYDIVFENVTFTYPSREQPALRNVNFRVTKESTVAVVGPSGSGKSTVVNLIQRFFAPDSGTIRIGGCDISQHKAKDIRELISVVAQDTYLFTGTIAENLRLAKADATEEELLQALETAGIRTFIEQSPEGLATHVGERGLTLSGGQRQRIAIARAVLADRPILILDEATSAVDAQHEKGILEALEKLTTAKTTIVIAHRLNTIEDADSIVVLQDSELDDFGTHDELFLRCALYRNLVERQNFSLTQSPNS